VTPADLEIEALIRAGIARTYPHDAVLGEEDGPHPGTTGCRWIIERRNALVPLIGVHHPDRGRGRAPRTRGAAASASRVGRVAHAVGDRADHGQPTRALRRRVGRLAFGRVRCPLRPDF
jgi:3'-phosphoadenosine 5'-phosphosulfate (PAPS) 3'-phosphatase